MAERAGAEDAAAALPTEELVGDACPETHMASRGHQLTL